ncbi:MAG: glycosyltransferase [Bacillota bacterium]
MTKPLVSVIMGVYNSEKTLDASIKSILNQTYEKWEFIICDDCSSDNTYEKLMEYKNAYPDKFIILKNENNMRLATSLNRCLDVAQGEFIARMDGDDISLPKRLESQVNFLQNNVKYDVVGSSIILFGDDGERGVRYFEGDVDKNIMLTSSPFAHPTIMMRKSSYDLLNGYTVSALTARCEDKDLWFRFFQHGMNGFNLSEPLLKYYENLNINGKKSLKQAINVVKVNYMGYKLLHFSKYKYVYLIKPIISAIVPQRFVYYYHKISGKTQRI